MVPPTVTPGRPPDTAALSVRPVPAPSRLRRCRPCGRIPPPRAAPKAGLHGFSARPPFPLGSDACQSILSLQTDRHLVWPKPAAFNPPAGTYALLSTISVTGPSLTSSTSIIAPNTPVSTLSPLARKRSLKVSYNSRAASGGAASTKLGLRPLRQSP